jgi:hypothetical protein
MTLTTVSPALLDTQAQYTGFKNRIINGDMRIDQRNAGAAVTGSGGYTFTVDRFKFYSSGASKLSGQQVASTYQGFTNRLKMTSLAATTPAAADEYELYHNLEGFNVADFGWGTTNAVPVTLSFIASSSLTGTFAGCVNNGAAGGTMHCFVFTYTISTANTDTLITITIPTPPVGGTWPTTSGQGFQIQWDLGSGSNYAGTSGSWGTSFKVRTSGSVNVVGTSGATFYLTGVQLEKGSTATAFDYLDYGRSLIQCQRYAQVYGGSGYETLANAYAFTGSDIRGIINLPTTMRAAPTGVFTGTWRAVNGSTQYASTAQVISEASTKNASFSFTVSGASAGQGGWVSAFNDSNARLILSAEL